MTPREYTRKNRELRAETVAALEAYQSLLGVLKTSGGHLRSSAQTVIADALADGLTQASIAKMLAVSRPAISYQVNRVI